jgi:hypothetical protein
LPPAGVDRAGASGSGDPNGAGGNAGTLGSSGGATSRGGTSGGKTNGGTGTAAGAAGASTAAAGAGGGSSGSGAAAGLGGAGGSGGKAPVATGGTTSAGAGGAGSGGLAASAGTSGAAGVAGTSSGSAGAAGAGAAGAGATSCASGSYAICEDFESTADGGVPTGWEKVGVVGAASDAAHRGARSLKIGAATSGARRMRLADSRIADLGGTHWGRLFYKVQTPAPVPASGVIHSTLVAWEGMSPISGTNEVRVVDTVEDAAGHHQYLFNVQTQSRGEFGKGSSYDFSYDGAWHCTEWYVDYSTQHYRFFLEGDELTSIGVMNGAGNFQNSELSSAYTALFVGWNNYQQAPGPGFVAWLDDLALASERIGCN